MKKVLIMGLPSAGKTTLAKALIPLLNAVHFNADEVRTNLHKDLGFDLPDRIEHARRLGWLCDQVARTGNFVIADFICPTAETRAAFGRAFVVWVDRVREGPYQDTNDIFEPPQSYDIRVTLDGTPEYWAEAIAAAVRPVFNPKLPTALFVGRYQPFHDGHKALIEEGLRRIGQACIAVRDTSGTNDENPFSFDNIRSRIDAFLQDYRGRYLVLPIPNIAAIFYGRDVGYILEQIDLDTNTKTISATALRSRMRRLYDHPIPNDPTTLPDA